MTTLKSASVTSSEFKNAFHQLQNLSQTDDEVALFLTQVLTQKGAIENGALHAFGLCQKLMDKGSLPAMEIQSDLLLWGVGVHQNQNQCFEHQRTMTEFGYIPQSTLAYFYASGIGTKKNIKTSSQHLLNGAAQGEVLSLALLANRYLRGHGVPQNFAAARAFSHLASEKGFPGMHNFIDQHLNTVPVEHPTVKQCIHLIGQWQQQYLNELNKLEQKTSHQDPQFFIQHEQMIQQIPDPKLPSDQALSANIEESIRHAEPSRLSPDILLIEGFISHEECLYLINDAADHLNYSDAVDNQNQRFELDAFSGRSTVFSATKRFPLHRLIQHKFSQLMQVPVSHFEPVSILKYEKGHEYTRHTDAFDPVRIQSHEQKGDFGGQRLTTNLIYLLPAEQGGETTYPIPDITIKGAMGTAIIHNNADPKTGQPLTHMDHQGLPIKSGQKWILRTATRETPLYGNNRVKL